MATRRQIKSLHENAVIGAALRAHNHRMGAAFSVESQPDPPDAILVDGNDRTWMEHTDAFIRDGLKISRRMRHLTIPISQWLGVCIQIWTSNLLMLFPKSF